MTRTQEESSPKLWSQPEQAGDDRWFWCDKKYGWRVRQQGAGPIYLAMYPLALHSNYDYEGGIERERERERERLETQRKCQKVKFCKPTASHAIMPPTHYLNEMSCLPPRSFNIRSHIPHQAVCARATSLILSEMIIGWMLIVVVPTYVLMYLYVHVRCAEQDFFSLGWMVLCGPPLQWFQSENERGWGKI